MKDNRNGTLAALLLMLVAAAIYLGPLWREGSSLALGDGYDGVKNQFTFLYHIQHGESLTHFSGSNAPYGDHVVFTDNQPLFSMPLRAAAAVLPETLRQDTGFWLRLFKLLLLLDLLLGALLASALLRRLGVHWAAAGVGAVFILLASPQIARLSGHYSLAYTFPYLLTLLLLVRCWERPSAARLVTAGAVILAAGLLHLYHLAIAGLLTGAFWLLALAYGRVGWKRAALFMGGQVVLPCLLLLLFIRSGSEGAAMRPSHPWGLDSYNARWEGLLLPVGLPAGDALNSVVGIRKLNAETLLYLGFPTALAVIAAVLTALYWAARRRWRQLARPFGDLGLANALVYTALACIVFAMGFPLALLPDNSGDYIGLLAQFRSLARFVFPAYYILAMLTMAALWRWSAGQAGRQALAAALMLVWAWEIHSGFGRNDRLRTYPVPQFEWVDKLDLSQWDALLALPYFAIGSENYGVDSKGDSQLLASWLSMRTGLPMVNYSLSRTRFDQNWAQLGRFAFFRAEPDDSLLAKRRFLVIHDKSCLELSPKEKALLRAASLLHEDEKTAAYSLTGGEIIKAERARRDALRASADSVAALPQEKIERRSFENQNAGEGCRSRRAWLTKMPATLYEGRLPESRAFRLSCWVKLYQPGEQALRVEFESENGLKLPGELTPYIDRMDGHWARLSFPLDSSLHGAAFKLWLRSSDANTSTYAIDELLLAPDGSLHVERRPDGLWIDNEAFAPKD